MDPAIIIELAKFAAQMSFAYMEQAGLSEDEKDQLLNGERDKFSMLTQTPLPEV